MKNLILAALTTLALSSSASAFGLAFTLDNLSFPPVEDVTECDAQTVCVPQR